MEISLDTPFMPMRLTLIILYNFIYGKIEVHVITYQKNVLL